MTGLATFGPTQQAEDMGRVVKSVLPKKLTSNISGGDCSGLKIVCVPLCRCTLSIFVHLICMRICNFFPQMYYELLLLLYVIIIPL